ncbi:PTS sugar transporter subunit IIA [Companilactobacillus insicii]|uniref:PTS sugar transporter subunit IIA n=1 Tax=Companilactobacillus insicii TaxID=1732567 RepID=UPI000F792B4F|nr:PTS glucose transporter subunit IIA [Companilactobacillus insicii]
MFNFFKKHKDLPAWDAKTFLSPADGEVIPIEKVNDPVFSQKAMGDGFGLNPTSNDIYSPVSGTVTMVAGTKHGIGISTGDSEELLVHMGIDTVELKGKPFNILVSQGDNISAGQKIAEMNLDEVKASGKETTIIVAVTNSAENDWQVSLEKEGKVNHSELVAKL